MVLNTPTQFETFSFDLPAELWTMVLRYLPLKARLQFRMLSTRMSDIATPMCFETLPYELSTREIDRLEEISADAKLCTQVKVLELRRARGLRDLGEFPDWERSISQPGDPDADSFDERFWIEDAEEADGEEIEDLMSYHEWSLLPKPEREKLYRAYEADRRSYQDQSRELTQLPYLRTLNCVRTTKSDLAGNATQIEEPPPLQRFDEAIAKFSNLHTVKCQPGFLHDSRWASRWRRLRFSYVALINRTNYHEDEDMEALQLSYTLRALGWAKQHHPRLQAMEMYVGGPAFWGIENLQSLWNGEGHGRTRDIRGLFGNVVEAQEHQHLDNSLQKEDCLRQLIIMEQSFINLIRLDCSISEEEEDGGLYAVVRPFFRFLCCAEKLEELRLVFGRLVDGSLQPECEPRHNGDGPAELLALLGAYRPWTKLRTLTLETAVNGFSLMKFLSSLDSSLQSLTLAHVTLPPQEGNWEFVLSQISDMPYLGSLKLSKLCDYPTNHPARQRVLFDYEADVWAERRSCYNEFESTTTNQILRGEQPTLDAVSFLNEHDYVCSH